MKSCRRFEGSLAAKAAGELSGRRFEALEAHLTGCAGCRETVGQYQAMRQAVKQEGLFAAGSLTLPEHTISRIAHRAAERPAMGWLMALRFARPVAAVVPAALLIALVSLPLVRPTRPVSRASDEPERLDVRFAGGQVRLAWSDGRERPYRVFKSSDPRRLGQGQGQLVKGNEWVDRNPGPGEIVFYRVE
jgi:anti-sigma factor RsiW